MDRKIGQQIFAQAVQGISEMVASKSVQMLALSIQEQWMRIVVKAGGKQGLEFANSIHVEQKGLLEYVIFSDDRRLSFLENGTPAFDMHHYLDTSQKVRISKANRKYMIIPIKHKAPVLGVVQPGRVEQWWLHSDRVSSVMRLDENGRAYTWGSRLTREDVAAMGFNPDQEGKHLVGMVRFEQESGHTEQVTFRVMAEGGKGWILPEKEGLNSRQEVLKWAQERAALLVKSVIPETAEGILKFHLE